MLFETLEARQLLAFTGTFTDVDGDTYRVELTGNGNAVVTTIDEGATDDNPLTGAIDQLTVTGTTTSSRLRVTVTKSPSGNGRVDLSGLTASVLRSASLAPVNSASGAAVTFDDVGQLIFGDVGSGANVSLNPAAPSTNLGRRTVTFGVIGFQLSISNGLRAATFTAKSVGNASLTLPLGVAKIVSSGDARIFFDAGASINEIRVGGFATLRGTINGDARTVNAGSFGPSSNSPLTVTGVLGTLSTKGDLASPFVAGRFGAVAAASITGGGLFWTTPDAQGIAIKSINVRGVVESGGISAVGNVGIDGVITSIKVGAFTNSSVSAVAVPTFRSSGAIVNSFVNLSQASGVASRSFTAAGRVTSLTLNTPSASGISSLKFAGLLESALDVGFITKITLGRGAEGGVRNSNLSLRGADAKGLAIQSASLGTGLHSSTLLATNELVGSIGSITGTSIESSTLTALRIKTLVLTGDSSGFALRSSQILAFDATVGVLGLGTLDFRGAVSSTNITSTSSIGRFVARSLSSSVFVNAGSLGESGELASTTAGMTLGNRINSITITKPFSAGAFTIGGPFVFNAPAIGNVSVAGRIDITGSGLTDSLFGFAAVAFGNVRLKNDQGQTLNPTIPVVSGNFNPFGPAPADLFTIRVIA